MIAPPTSDGPGGRAPDANSLGGRDQAPSPFRPPQARPGGGLLNRVIYRGLLASLAYVFMIDGYVRLRTGSSNVTLLRDVILGGVVLLGLAVICVRNTKIERAPLVGLVVAFVGVTLVEVFNPDAVSVKLGLEALRPHLEFVPMFFVAFAVMRTEDRLRGLAILFVIAGAVNGIVSLIQSQLTPAQLGAWGSGYHTLVTAVILNGHLRGAATYINGAGHAALRPPALGGTFGFGGALGMCALPFALALVLERKGRTARWVGIVGVPLIGAAVVSSQTRAAVIGTVVTLVAFLWFTAVRDRSLIAPMLAVVMLGLLIVMLSGFDLGRYQSITPTQLTSTFSAQRGGSIDVIPTYAARYPFGAGLGTSGPAASLSASLNTGKLSGENAFTFLLVELGISGLLCVLALFAVALRRGAVLALTRGAASGRLYLAAITSGLIGCSVLWLSGGVTAAPPLSPFIWLAFGVIAAWTLVRREPPAHQ